MAEHFLTLHPTGFLYKRMHEIIISDQVAFIFGILVPGSMSLKAYFSYFQVYENIFFQMIIYGNTAISTTISSNPC